MKNPPFLLTKQCRRQRWLSPIVALQFLVETCSPPSAQAVAGPACLAVTAVVMVAGVVCFLRACKPRAHCALNPQTGEIFCTLASRRTCAANGWIVGVTNHASMEACEKVCNETNLTRTGTVTYVPREKEFLITAEKSTDGGKTWAFCGQDIGTADCWEIVVTNSSPAEARRCDFRTYSSPYLE